MIPAPNHKPTFQQFWPLYLESHRHVGTRCLHYMATFIGISAVSLTAALSQIWFMLIGIPISYALALGSHRWIERSPSLMVVNPVYGAAADLRMCWLALTGRLAEEYVRLGLASPQRVADVGANTQSAAPQVIARR